MEDLGSWAFIPLSVFHGCSYHFVHFVNFAYSAFSLRAAGEEYAPWR